MNSDGRQQASQKTASQIAKPASSANLTEKTCGHCHQAEADAAFCAEYGATLQQSAICPKCGSSKYSEVGKVYA